MISLKKTTPYAFFAFLGTVNAIAADATNEHFTGSDFINEYQLEPFDNLLLELSSFTGNLTFQASPNREYYIQSIGDTEALRQLKFKREDDKLSLPLTESDASKSQSSVELILKFPIDSRFRLRTSASKVLIPEWRADLYLESHGKGSVSIEKIVNGSLDCLLFGDNKLVLGEFQSGKKLTLSSQKTSHATIGTMTNNPEMSIINNLRLVTSGTSTVVVNQPVHFAHVMGLGKSTVELKNKVAMPIDGIKSLGATITTNNK